MKEKTIVAIIIGAFVVIGFTAAMRATDIVFVVASVAFFALCIAYAEWCERL